MLNRDVVTVFLEQVPDEIRALRDSIAKAEADHTGLMWESQRELQGHVKELRDRCEETSHPLAIALTGKVGTRRRLLRNSRDARKTCIMCGIEDVGTLTTGFPSRLLFRRAQWTFSKLDGYITRSFTDAEWYFETVSIIRNFSFSSDIVLQHAFPIQLPFSLLAGQSKNRIGTH